MRVSFAIVTATILLAACARSPHVETRVPPSYADTTTMLAFVRATTLDFHERLRALEHPLSFVPDVVLNSQSGLLFYNGPRRRIVLPFWPDLSPSARSLYSQVGGSADSAAVAFAAINWFYLPHELAHQVLAETGPRLTRYENERRATVWAVAYWRARGESGRLEYVRQLAVAAAIRMAAADPAPPEADRVQYFNENYSALIANPPAYVVYHMRMLAELLADPTLPEFSTLAQALTPRSPNDGWY
jgi:hypothetical protein